MAIWSAEIKELEKLYESLKGQLPDLEKEVARLIKADDENMILLYSRRCLEVIITDLCECELKRPRKTEPLKGIIDKLHKEEKVSSHIITSMHGLNELSTYGAHPKNFDLEQVKPVLSNLAIIIKWYLKYKETGTDIKTTPAKKTNLDIKGSEDAKKSILIQKKRLAVILSGLILLSIIVVAGLFFTNVIGSGKQTKQIEKSIAVLPFKLLSDEQDKQYLADGMMDAITLHLSKIKDLRVMSRTSVEQYRETTKTTREIGKELDVEYLLEGSFQKYGDNARLIVQLIKTSEESHAWGNEYNNKWSDVFSLQSEVAQAIASELYAVMTPEEKQTIEKIPTPNLTAYDFYQRGKEELVNYWLNDNNKETLKRAENFYYKALEYDSTFAAAYSGLAIVYIYQHRIDINSYFAENYLDSAMILADRALSYDDKLAEVYYVRGLYNLENGKSEQAVTEFDKALKYNPNYWEVYADKGSLLYSLYIDHLDFVKAIENLNKAISINHGKELRDLLFNLARVYDDAGFREKFEYYMDEYNKLVPPDTNSFWNSGVYNELSLGNYEKAFEIGNKIYSRDSNNVGNLLNLGEYYGVFGLYKESLKYYKKYVTTLKNLGQLDLLRMHRIGYVFWQNGFKKESEYYFNEQKRICEESIKMGRSYSFTFRANYDLAGVYAFMGDRDKAYENLRVWATIPVFPVWWVDLIKQDPLFDSIRAEPEFQQIVRDVEAKYQAEHERLKKWLEEQGML